MSKPVNLGQHRKQRARQEKRVQGNANAAKFGETKHQRNARDSETQRVTRLHEAHKRDD